MKIVILDRDGVINQDSPDYIKSVAEWHPIPGSLEAIAKLCQAGFRVFVASNQSGLGQGLFNYDDFCAMNDRMQKLLAELGGRIDGIAFAPDHPDTPTPNRKPAPGMAKAWCAELDVDPARCGWVSSTPSARTCCRAGWRPRATAPSRPNCGGCGRRTPGC